MALNLSNSSNLEQLALKGLRSSSYSKSKVGHYSFSLVQ